MFCKFIPDFLSCGTLVRRVQDPSLMASPILWVTFLGLVALIARYAVGLHRNIQLAKRIGVSHLRLVGHLH